MPLPSSPPLTIRVLSAAEMHLPVDWAAGEGWNPGRHDAAAFHAADPEGFLLAELDGEPAGVISAVQGGTGLGFLGFYIVAPAFRGKGYGMALWRAAMARMEGRTVGLDGVVAQQENYAKSGFVLAHRNLRYGGWIQNRPEPQQTGAIKPADEVHFSRLLAYDGAHFGGKRPEFLRSWLAMPESRARVSERDGELCGFGVVRRCLEGCKIGPLFAADEATAEALFIEFADFAAGGPLFIDPPEPNGAAVELARRHGLEPVFETARMYRGPAPTLPLRQIYGITSFELG